MASSSSSSSQQQQQQQQHQEEEEEEGGTLIIPGLPDDISSSILLSLVPISLFPSLSSTSRRWLSLLSSTYTSPSPTSSSSSSSSSSSKNQLLCIFPGDPHVHPSPQLLDPLTLLWLPLPPLPPNPHAHSLTNFHPLPAGPFAPLVLLGGSRFDSHTFPLNQPSPSSSSFLLPTLLPAPSPSWSRLPDMLTPRGSFACAVAPDRSRIFVAGGGSRHASLPNEGTRTNAVEVLDLGTWEWRVAEPLRKVRAGCVGWVMKGVDGLEDEFWVVGGHSGYRTESLMFPVDVHCRDGEAFGLRTGRWREIGDMWEEGERWKLGKIAVVDEERAATKVFMLDHNSIFRYDIASNRWFKVTTLRRKLSRDTLCGFVAVNRELYVLTSSIHVADSKRPLKKKVMLDMQIYDPKKRKWRFLTAPSPFKELDFRTAVLCTIQL